MRIYSLTVVVLAAATGIQAQTAPLPPVRKLAAPVAVSPKIFRGVTSIRAIANGRLLVNDVIARRLVNVDTAFRDVNVISDTTSGSVTPYGTAIGGLLPFLGDSSLLVETTTPVIYVIDPNGKIARSLSLPSPRDANWLVQSSRSVWPSTDALGRLIYSGPATRDAAITPKAGEYIPFAFPDSGMIRRADLATRKVETLSWYRQLKIAGWRTQTAAGMTATLIANDPIPVVDDWTVLQDGTIAVLRGDFHLDLIDADGKITATPRIPYPWQRLTDEGKIALMDSVRTADSVRTLEQSATPPAGTSTGTARGSGLIVGGPPGGFPTWPPELKYVKPERLADYRPAFSDGAMRPDARNNLWIRTRQPASDTSVAVYYVVHRDGKLLDRVELPRNRTIVGFDKSNALYLSGRDAEGVWLERFKTDH